jgi:hypothetical protein
MGRLIRLLLFLSILFVVVSTIWYFFIPEDADMVFVDGRVYTLDEDNDVAEAIAVRGDRIVGVGSKSYIQRKFRSRQVVGLRNLTVLPGFIDAHAHLLSLGIARMTVDLTGVASEEEAVKRVESRVKGSQPGKWIRGRGWDQNLWAGRRFPNRSTLDAVARRNPVFLTRVDGHACWVNSEALRMAGVTRSTPDPPGGKIMRDARGNPTGVFIDAAMELIAKRLPPMSKQESVEALALAVDECLENGITTIHDMGVDSSDIELYKAAIDREMLPVRVYAAIGGPGPLWIEFMKTGPLIGYGNNNLTIRSIKLYVDGALGSRGAALIEPYADDPGNRGLTVTSEEELRKTVDEALSHGFQVCTHAIGDRGNSIVLDVYEAAVKGHPHSNHRLRVEHAQVLSAADIPRFRQLGVLPSMQPTHCTSDMYWAEARLGAKRVRGAYAWRSLLKTGVVIPCGSDFPVENPNPLWGIYSAVTRQDHNGRPASAEDVRRFFQLSGEGVSDTSAFNDGWYADQKMTRLEAIRGFTSWAAYAAFEEDLKGTIEKGKLADFIVLSKDIVAVPPKEILETVVELTVIGGRVVYRRVPSGHKPV